jgi:hypothetical protein
MIGIGEIPAIVAVPEVVVCLRERSACDNKKRHNFVVQMPMTLESDREI